MNTNYDIIQKLIGLQGIKIIYSNVNNGIFKVLKYQHNCVDNARKHIQNHIGYSLHLQQRKKQLSNVTTEENNHKVKNLSFKVPRYI